MSINSKLMMLAESIADLSHDPSTKVGAVITKNKELIAMGYNHIAPRFSYRLIQLDDRAWKYPRTIHAEISAINASRLHGPLTREHHMYITHHPCEACALQIVYSGIGEIYTRKPSVEMLTRWPGMALAKELFQEAEVVVNYLP